MRPIVFVTVDADIAAGKSTLVERLRDRLRWRVVVADEPVDAWQASGLLADMYAALDQGPPSADGMPGMFQIYAFSTRAAKLAATMRQARALSDECGDTVVVLSERSVFSDRDVFKHMLVADGHITPVQQRVYDGCFEALIPAIVPDGAPDLCIWVDSEPDLCMQRHKQRARPGETLSPDYAASLHRRHVELFGGDRATLGGVSVPVLRIDGRLPYHTDDAVLASIVARIENAIERCA